MKTIRYIKYLQCVTVISSLSCRSLSPGKSNEGTTRKHPIQRAPSRLYRTVQPVQGNPRAKYCCPNTCIGPEFVVNSSSSVKHIRMTDIKVWILQLICLYFLLKTGAGRLKFILFQHSSQIRRITVILLNGRKLKVSCNINTMTTGQLFDVRNQC